jgi:hypothetical protein
MINPLELPNHVLLDKSTLPAIPAIYFVVEDSTILYVGSTLNLKQRWQSHHKYETIVKDYPEAKIHFYFIDNLDTLRSLETFFINELSPILNSDRVFVVSKNCHKLIAKKTKRINVTVSDETYEELSLLADKQKRSVASLVNYLTTEGLEQAERRGELPKKEDLK